MSTLLILLVLAAVWMTTLGTLDAGGLLVGLLVGGAALLVTQGRTAWPRRPGAPRLRKLWQIPLFGLWVVWELVKANVSVAKAVMSPIHRLRPGVVAVPLELLSPAELTILANVLTLTPGTLSLDISSDRRTLYVHFLNAGDREAVRREVKENFERRVMEVMR